MTADTTRAREPDCRWCGYPESEHGSGRPETVCGAYEASRLGLPSVAAIIAVGEAMREEFEEAIGYAPEWAQGKHGEGWEQAIKGWRTVVTPRP